MTPTEISELEIEVLRGEVNADLAALDRISERLVLVVTRVGDLDAPPPEEVMMISGFLHHLYTGMEAIMQRIGQGVDGTVPTGDRWHQELLSRMSVDVRNVRSRLLHEETAAGLARLLRFRHFFRHAYRIDFLWAEVSPLAHDAPSISRRFHEDVVAFMSGVAPP